MLILISWYKTHYIGGKWTKIHSYANTKTLHFYTFFDSRLNKSEDGGDFNGTETS
jgi:hypothetical protein